MSFIRNRNRITGKRFNDVTTVFDRMGDRIPLTKEVRVVDDDRITLLHQGSDGPLLGVESPERAIPVRAIRGTFDDDDELDVGLENHHYVIRKGKKDEYHVPLIEWGGPTARMPELQLDNTLTLNPKVIGHFADIKIPRKGEPRIYMVSGRDPDGASVMHLVLAVDLCKCIGYESVPFRPYDDTVEVCLPWDYFKPLLKVKGNIEIDVKSHHPIKARWGSDVRNVLLVAPIVPIGDKSFDDDIYEYIRANGGECGRF